MHSHSPSNYALPRKEIGTARIVPTSVAIKRQENRLDDLLKGDFHRFARANDAGAPFFLNFDALWFIRRPDVGHGKLNFKIAIAIRAKRG